MRRLLTTGVGLTHSEHDNDSSGSRGGGSSDGGGGLSWRRLYLPRFNTRSISGSDKSSRGKNVAESWQIINSCGHFPQDQNPKLVYVYLNMGGEVQSAQLSAPSRPSTGLLGLFIPVFFGTVQQGDRELLKEECEINSTETQPDINIDHSRDAKAFKNASWGWRWWGWAEVS